MPKKEWTVVAGIIVVVVVVASAVGIYYTSQEPAPVEGEIKAGYSLYTLGMDFFVALSDAGAAAAQDMGVDFYAANCEGSVEQQNNQIETLVTVSGVDLIFINPAESAACGSAVQTCAEYGVPVITVDASVTEKYPNVLMYISVGQSETAALQATCIVELLNKKYGDYRGKVLFLQGLPKWMGARLRATGAMDVFDIFPEIEVVRVICPIAIDGAYSTARDALTANPDVDAIWVNYDPAAMGALQAMKDIGMFHPIGEEGHIILTGFDGCPAILEAIQAGEMDATTVQPANYYLPLALEYGLAYLENGEAAIPEIGTIVIKEGAPWSPARVESWEGYHPWLMLKAMVASYEDIPNVDTVRPNDPRLWGNMELE